MLKLLRLVLGALTIVGLVVATACAPAAAPSPTTSSAKPATKAAEPAPAPAAKPAAKAAEPAPAAKPAAKAAEPAPAAKPAAKSAEPAAKPASAADWKTEWDKTLAAAKREGKVAVLGGPGDIYRDAYQAFQRAYPDIKLEFMGGPGREMVPKVLAERQGGLFLWDIYIAGANSPIDGLRPVGALDPIQPAFILPEILDSSKWHGGFDDSWVDKERKYAFAFEGSLDFLALVNRDLVPESELKSMDQLLDPKWKGKMVSLDPRVAGNGSANASYQLLVKGEAWLRKLLAQDLVVTTDPRQLAEFVIRGRYPIGLGVHRTAIEPLRAQGVGLNVKPLEADTESGARMNSGFGNIFLMNKAPNPNAARVFINWLLSKDGQTEYVKATQMNSRRLDVVGNEYALRPNVKYKLINKEEYQEYLDNALKIAKELIK